MLLLYQPSQVKVKSLACFFSRSILGSWSYATLFIIGIILILMKGEIPEKWAMSLEFLVGIMLVYLGVKTIFSFKNIHIHHHQHDGDDHKHVHSHQNSG